MPHSWDDESGNKRENGRRIAKFRENACVKLLMMLVNRKEILYIIH